MSHPGTPIKLKPYIEQRKAKINQILAKNSVEPNKYLHAMRLGICQFKIEQINKLNIGDENVRRNEVKRRNGIS